MMKPGSIVAAEALQVIDLLTPPPGSTASRVLAKTPGGIVTLFAFDTGQGLKEHTAPFDALVLVLAGGLSLTIGANKVEAGPGTIVRLPAHIPHAVDTTAASRMLLIMLREPSESA